MVGKITKLNPKGWMFIYSMEKPFTRIFAHWSALSQTTKNFTELQLGDTVQFELTHIPDRGYRAMKISVLVPQDIDNSITMRPDYLGISREMGTIDHE